MPFLCAHDFNDLIPKWLMTFTAIRPDLGFLNGREVVRFKLSQASSSILVSFLAVCTGYLHRGNKRGEQNFLHYSLYQ